MKRYASGNCAFPRWTRFGDGLYGYSFHLGDRSIHMTFRVKPLTPNQQRVRDRLHARGLTVHVVDSFEKGRPLIDELCFGEHA